MKYARSVLLGVACMIVAGDAWAADSMNSAMPAMPAAPVEDPAPRWSGFHIGIGSGFQFDNATSTLHTFDGFWGDDFSTTDLLQGQAAFLTVEAGADVQAGSVVFGAFANYDHHPFPASDSQGGASGFAIADATVTWGDAWAAGGRVGYLVSPETLFYALGGYGQKQMSATVTTTDDLDSSVYNIAGWQGGWLAGFGLERMLGDHLSIKGEYRFARYAALSGTFPCNGFCDIGDTADINTGPTNSHTVRLVLSLRFGGN